MVALGGSVRPMNIKESLSIAESQFILRVKVFSKVQVKRKDQASIRTRGQVGSNYMRNEILLSGCKILCVNESFCFLARPPLHQVF